MTAIKAPELPVVGCIRYRPDGPCFALPILAVPGKELVRAVQQVDEISNLISGFSFLEDYAHADVIPIDGPLAKAGGQLVHCFINETGEACAGNLETLGDALKAFINRCPNQTSVVLQILELIGTDQEKKSYRAKMRSDISRTAGDRAAYAFYERATLRAALWQRLVASAPTGEAAERILRARPNLGASISSDGEIVLELSELDSRDYAWINQLQLVSSLMKEFEVKPNPIQPSSFLHFDIKPDNVVQVGRVSDFLKYLSSVRRQEERVAILADAILHNRDIGISALIQYGNDRAKFANAALTELRAHLTQKTGDRESDELVIANIVPRLFTLHYPLSRGELLYYLAKHLAKWPIVNKAIRRSLDRTNSLFVANWRDEVEKLLDRPPTSRTPFLPA